MAEHSKIEWTDHTFNPWIGCSKVSPGCDNCYAARQDGFRRWTPEGWGGPRKLTKTWGDPKKWNDQAAAQGRRYRVFCASLADVFDNEVPPVWRAELFDLITATPQLDWLLLTKRIGNAWKMMADALGVSMASLKLPPPNIWLGTTVVNQAEAERDIPKLLQVPARVRFLSIEPMLGPIDLVPYIHCDVGNAVDWVICGGESGPGARPMHPDWARSLRDQCAEARVPFLFKQWGEYAPPIDSRTQYPARLWREFPPEGGPARPVHYVGDLAAQGYMLTLKLGKKVAGRMLDGQQHDGFPTP